MKKNLFYNHNEQQQQQPQQPSTTTTRSHEATEWWWDCVHLLRENTLVTIANMSTYLNLDHQQEDVIELFAHGLIHWSICRSEDAQDTCQDSSLVSPQRLAIEALSKMTINDVNVDLILATMSGMKPYINMLISTLCTDFLVRRDDETNREFSIVLITALAKCDQFSARSIAKYASCLITFIEDFEEHARRNNLLNPHIQMISENMTTSNISEEHLGTTVEMLRRCAKCLGYLAVHEENIPMILKYENRLLDLITSHFVDYQVVQKLSEVLFFCNNSESSVDKNESNATNKDVTEFKYSFLNPQITPAYIS